MNAARVLVVEDNVANLKLVCEMLAFKGYHLLTATDAEQAKKIIQHTQPDLILMDIGLPGMDGLTLARQLKNDEKTRHIVIVALTAYAMSGDEHKAIAAGCEGYVTKPIDTRKLPAQIASLLQGVHRKQGSH